MAAPSPALSASQLATLAGLGEERTAGVGDVLYRLGDATYPFIAIREGEVAILHAAGNEIVRHGASSLLGDMKRCATAVGEGAMAVQLVHVHLSAEARLNSVN